MQLLGSKYQEQDQEKDDRTLLEGRIALEGRIVFN